MPLSVVEFQDPNGEIIVARIPQEGTAELRMGSVLIVQDGQVAVFYRDGHPTDVFKAGRHKLTTRNLPGITKLLKLPSFGFKSPFRAYVYFVQLRTFVNLGWGTPTPILFRDSEFKAVHLRAHGSFSLRVKAPGVFLKSLVGSKGLETTHAVEEFVRRVVVSRLIDILPTVLDTVLDLPTHYQEIAVQLKKAVHDDLDQYGFELVDLLVEAITVPDEVQQTINRAAGSRSIDDGEVARYQRVAEADALRDSAKQPGGGALASGFGVGAGIGMAARMAGAPGQAQGVQAGPPPLPSAAPQWYAAVGGQQAGPFAQEALLAQIQSGQITRETLVWRDGMANWVAAGQVPDLGQLFGGGPPPIPPA